jgi:Asp-tRNA(Asn)/Glu-tRNA(Gln) amidotransferase A subunit family amidase
MYGGFTPVGGIFAILTSMGVLGTLARSVTLVAMCIATLVAATVGTCGARK